MSRFGKVFVISFLLLAVAFSTLNVNAHPPEDMKLRYDIFSQTLYVWIEHRVSNPFDDYIKTIRVEVKGEEYYEEYVFRFDSQPTPSVFTYPLSPVIANCGDLITATAYCSKGGSISRTIIACQNTPPVVIITYPKEGQEVYDTVRIEIIAYDADMYDVVYTNGVQVSFDKPYGWHPAKPGIEKDYWYYDWDTTNFADGQHTIYARAYDGEDYGHDMVNVTVNNDPNPPSLNINKPKEGCLYIFDREIMSVGTTIIIGKITIKADAYDAESGMDRVEFYINDELKYTDVEVSYEWIWGKTPFGIYEIKVVAYDKKGNSSNDSLTVLKMF